MKSDEISMSRMMVTNPNREHYNFYIDGEVIGTIYYNNIHFQLWPVVNGSDLESLIDTFGCGANKKIPVDNKRRVFDICRVCLANFFNGDEIPINVDYRISELLSEEEEIYIGEVQ